MVAWCPTLYLLMLFIAQNRIGAMLDDAVGWSEWFGALFAGLFLFGIGGHIAYGIVIAKLIPAPRWRARIVLLTLGSLASTCLFLMSSAPPEVIALAMVVVPAGLGYLAAAPRWPAPELTDRYDRLVLVDAQ